MVHNESEPIQNWRLVQTKAGTYMEFTHSRLISVRRRKPEGVASASPGLPYSPTLGDSAASMRCQSVAATPTGLRPGLVTKHDDIWLFIIQIEGGATPVGVGSARSCPKVAEYDNLGLCDAIPVGLHLNGRPNQTSQRSQAAKVDQLRPHR